MEELLEKLNNTQAGVYNVLRLSIRDGKKNCMGRAGPGKASVIIVPYPRAICAKTMSLVVSRVPGKWAVGGEAADKAGSHCNTRHRRNEQERRRSTTTSWWNGQTNKRPYSAHSTLHNCPSSDSVMVR